MIDICGNQLGSPTFPTDDKTVIRDGKIAPLLEYVGCIEIVKRAGVVEVRPRR
jgi:hypothetical protein